MSSDDEGYIPFEGFETLAECKDRLAKLVRKLKAAGPDYDEIRHMLEGHGDDDWTCKHPVCPICLRGRRAKFIRNAASMIRTKWAKMDGRLGYLTYVPNQTLPKGELAQLDLREFKDLLAKHIARAGLDGVLLVGGVDISYNVHEGLLGDKYWQPHLHAVGLFPVGLKRSSKLLSEYVDGRSTAYRPVKITALSRKGGLKSALGYCMKPYLDRREHYLNHLGETWDKFPLRGEHLLESVRYLNDWKPNARVFTRGVKRKGLSFEIDVEPSKPVGGSKSKSDQ